eukprot:6209258-Pleurochrysis_carterae.AAC.1
MCVGCHGERTDAVLRLYSEHSRSSTACELSSSRTCTCRLCAVLSSLRSGKASQRTPPHAPLLATVGAFVLACRSSSRNCTSNNSTT